MSERRLLGRYPRGRRISTTALISVRLLQTTCQLGRVGLGKETAEEVRMAASDGVDWMVVEWLCVVEAELLCG